MLFVETIFTVAVHRSKHGLDLPIAGKLASEVEALKVPSRVAILGGESIGLKPTMLVQAGDSVEAGQALFEDKKNPGVRYTAPVGGTVEAVNRGERRAFRSLVIALDSSARTVSFDSFSGSPAGGLTRQQVTDLLLESGEWTALRSRPFGRVASPQSTPHAILVNGMDTQPLAIDPLSTIAGREVDFRAGLEMLTKLTDGVVYVTTSVGKTLDTPAHERIRHEQFAGPHPAGNSGYQIHRLIPVSRRRTVWYLDVQEAVALGHLGRTGRLDTQRVVSISGPMVSEPRLMRVMRGALVNELLGREGDQDGTRTIAGSALSGRQVSQPDTAYLGRFDRQVTVLAEDRERKFLGWMAPGGDRFSVTKTFASALAPGRRFAMATSTYGSKRAIVPIGLYERVTPFDFEPTFLIKALVMDDLERAEELGCLELVEEDVDLWTFVCPGKNDYRPALRRVLNELEKDA